MECKTHLITKNITCNNTIECSNKLRIKLEKQFNCKLMALKENDTVNGALTIDHTPSKHIITLDFYEKDENANNEHASKLKKLGKIPNLRECEIAIN